MTSQRSKTIKLCAMSARASLANADRTLREIIAIADRELTTIDAYVVHHTALATLADCVSAVDSLATVCQITHQSE